MSGGSGVQGLGSGCELVVDTRQDAKCARYPAYRPSGVPWLGDVPEHWENRPLKHWGEINAAVLPESTSPDYQFRYLDIGTVGTGALSRKPQALRFSEAPSRARRVIGYGDTIVSTVRTYLKAVYFVSQIEDDWIASTGFAVLSPGPHVEPKFLSYLAQSDPFTNRVCADSVGTAYPAIAETRLGSFHVAMPPLPEQRAIVRYLDHHDRLIRRYLRAQRRLIALLHEQKQAIIQQAVTRGLDPTAPMKDTGVEWLGEIPAHWEVVGLRFRYSVQLGKMLDTKRITGDYLVPYLRNMDVQWDRVNDRDLPMMDITPAEYERYTLRPGDILVCEGGEVGRTALWHGGIELCGYQKALHRLRPLSMTSDVPRFVYYVMRCAAKLGVFSADGSENTIAHLTAVKLRSHRLAFPPATEQQAIVAVLDAQVGSIERAVTGIDCEMTLVREYRTRLIADVVTGKLDVRAAAATLPELEPEEAAELDDGEDEQDDDEQGDDQQDDHDEDGPGGEEEDA